MRGLPTKARTAASLGLQNLARVGQYRLAVRAGVHPVQRVNERLPMGPYFRVPSGIGNSVRSVASTRTPPRLFGWFGFPSSGVELPNTCSNALTGVRVQDPLRPWWQIPDFDPHVGDVKTVWELSRLDWVVWLAQEAVRGDSESLVRLNAWLGQWTAENPAFLGPNWKCGQEASIRVLRLALAALLLGQVPNPNPSLLELVRVHLRRIAPTVAYAVAQDNNHGTSEAAALFVGGRWLRLHGFPEGKKWERLGRAMLEERTLRLFAPDGSFSQYSLNYHRLALDTLSFVELWRRNTDADAFSARWMRRAQAAADWLRSFVEPSSGDAPNLGANDGALLLPLTGADYRDHRPSVQLAVALFSGQLAYPDAADANEALGWLGVPLPSVNAPPASSRVFDDGGYAVLRRGAAMALLRFPRFRFRPSQADALHLDFWLGTTNFFRDAGTYSYAAGAEDLRYFPGTAAHNTIQFDDRDQMPRLGRFLFGDWLTTSRTELLQSGGNLERFAAEYRDREGARHARTVELEDDQLCVRDDFGGFRHKAVLRWRLPPGEWTLRDGVITDGECTLSVESSVPISRQTITTGWESRYYLQKTPLPVLEVEVRQAGSITSRFRWPEARMHQ